jgi:hypothetical protein
MLCIERYEGRIDLTGRVRDVSFVVNMYLFCTGRVRVPECVLTTLKVVRFVFTP